MPAYQFKSGSHIAGDAQAVGERLAKLESAGELTPRAVVDDARSESSPLHPLFEWNDAEAADRYRLVQAGHVIRCVVVTVEDADPEQMRVVRAFVPVIDESEHRSYVTTMRALADKNMRAQVLQQAYSELDAVLRKYRELRELSEVVQAVDRVGEMLTEGQPH